MSGEVKPMSYCEFIKCASDPERITEETGPSGCSIAWSGESCWTLYPVEEGETPSRDFIAYELYLEELRLNNEKEQSYLDAAKALLRKRLAYLGPATDFECETLKEELRNVLKILEGK